MANKLFISGSLGLENSAIAYSALSLSNSIVNSDINSSAAIAYSKLDLSTSIVNADVAPGAAIAYSKLNLATSIVNADISASAAIAYSKLNLATSIVNGDISASAAIAYSKLSLAASIVNADISASAAIAYSKLDLAASVLASDINSGAATSGLVLAADGSGGASWSSAASGTVTSVAVSVPSILTVSGSPVTSSGTIAIDLATEAANKVLAGPTTGADAQPTFRSLVAADIPDLSATYELVSNFAVRSYNNSISLADSVGSPTTIPAFTTAVASYGAMELKYVIIEDSTNSRRLGTLRISTDGTLVGYADEYVESSTIGTGLVLSAAISGTDIIVQFTGTNANACTMRAEIVKFVA